MFKLLRIISVVIFCFAVSGCAQHNSSDDSQVVAKINNYELTQEDFRNEALLITGNKRLPPDQFKAKEELLEEMINKKILIQEAQKLNFDKQKSFMKEIERYWEQALLKLLFKQKAEELFSSIQVSQQEIEARYSRMKKKFIAEILVLNDKTAAEKFSQPQADFEELKIKFSDNIALGRGPSWFTYAELPPELEDALYSLKSGEVSRPIKYSGDWAVIRVLKEDDTPVQPLDKIYEQVKEDLLQVKRGQVLNNWMAEVRRNASVNINQKVLDEIQLNRRAYGE